MVFFQEKRDEWIPTIKPNTTLVEEKIIPDVEIWVIQSWFANASYKGLEFLRRI